MIVMTRKYASSGGTQDDRQARPLGVVVPAERAAQGVGAGAVEYLRPA